MKYKSELIHEILEQRGHEKSTLHYQSECVKSWVDETKGAYPKLCDYESEWLNYINENPIGEFPYETVTTNNTATINNVVPFAYKSVILKGSTKYRDIDSGEFLETFEEGRNLELVTVQMPVLTTTGKNLFDISKVTNFNVIDNKIIIPKTGANKELIPVSIINPNQPISITLNHNITEPNGSWTPVIAVNYTDGSKTEKYFNQLPLITPNDKIIDSIYMRNPWTVGAEMYNIQIEQNSQPSSYEPFKSNILSTSDDVTLRGIGNVQDELDLLSGELTERIGEIVLDGSQNLDIQFNTNSQQPNTAFVQYNDSRFEKGEAISCNLPKANGELWGVSSYDNQFVFNYLYYNENNKKIQILIPYSMLKTIDISGVKQFLSENPIKILLPIKESVKTVDLTTVNEKGETTHFKPLEGTMHLTTSSETINPLFSGEIPVEAITQNLTSFIKE